MCVTLNSEREVGMIWTLRGERVPKKNNLKLKKVDIQCNGAKMDFKAGFLSAPY